MTVLQISSGSSVTTMIEAFRQAMIARPSTPLALPVQTEPASPSQPLVPATPGGADAQALFNALLAEDGEGSASPGTGVLVPAAGDWLAWQTAAGTAGAKGQSGRA